MMPPASFGSRGSPPTAPSRIASCFARESRSSSSRMLPVARKCVAPNGYSVVSNATPSGATALRTLTASVMTSGPIPSPGMTAMLRDLGMCLQYRPRKRDPLRARTGRIRWIHEYRNRNCLVRHRRDSHLCAQHPGHLDRPAPRRVHPDGCWRDRVYPRARLHVPSSIIDDDRAVGCRRRWTERHPAPHLDHAGRPAVVVVTPVQEVAQRPSRNRVIPQRGLETLAGARSSTGCIAALAPRPAVIPLVEEAATKEQPSRDLTDGLTRG